jgi:hypothetical protein
VTPLKDSQIPAIKKAMADGYTLEQVKSKYSVTPKQLELINEQ